MYNILICDDDRDIVEALKIYLSGEDYRLFAAYNGQEALEVVRQHEIHCILMDVMMPKMDGITATAALRRRKRAAASPPPSGGSPPGHRGRGGRGCTSRRPGPGALPAAAGSW